MSEALIDQARISIAVMMEDLEGEEDFIPFMTIRSRDTNRTLYVGMDMPGDNKDLVADTMTVLCATHRAAEVVFASVAWMVTKSNPASRTQWVAPSKDPDRVETVFILEAKEDAMVTHTAPVTRENNAVRLGEWSSFPATADVTGRFGDAIRMGMGWGRSIPPDLGEFIDTEMAEGRGERIITGLTRTLRSERTRLIAEMASRN